MAAVIRISDLQARCILGVGEDERREKQEVLINLDLTADLAAAAAADDFSLTVDYRDLKKRVLAFVEASEFYLLEALTDRVAELCLQPPQVQSVRVRIEKPAALRFARTVAVELEKQRPPVLRVYVAVGSNVDPERHVPAALRLLSSRLRLQALSTLYRTPALGRPEQADYVNGMVSALTDLTPAEVRLLLRDIERQLGRQRTADKWAAREIDLDLVAAEPPAADPLLPDPEIASRAFLSVPLGELAPELRLGDATAAELAQRAERKTLTPQEALTRQTRQEAGLEH